MSRTPADNSAVSFRALQLANEHRSAYGLRYNDFTRYRNHCGNRTHRLRSSLKTTHGKGREFKKLPAITLESIKAGHLQLLLFETERAWSYSQELYAASLQPANKDGAAKLRHSATGRFRRALHWCTQLLSHCQGLYAVQRFSAEDMLEISAYTLILSGRFLRFRDEFEDALDQLCVASDILDHLSEFSESSRDQALATLFSDEISPEIRYCAHQLGKENPYDIDRIVKEVTPKQRAALVENYEQLLERLGTEGRGDDTLQSRERLQALIWEGQPVPVRNPELVDVLLEVQRTEALLRANDDAGKLDTNAQAKRKGRKRHQKSRKGVAAFDAILAALSDAEEVSRKLVEAQRTSNSPANTGSASRDILFLHAYIVYHLLSRRVERDLTLVSALITSSQGSRPQTETKNAKGSQADDDQSDARVNPAIIKLLDTVVQSLSHMRSLSIVDESPDLASSLETRLAFTKSRRCVYLARSYAAVKQHAQALSLCQRSHLYIREASSILSTQSVFLSPLFYPLSFDIITELEQSLNADEIRFKCDWFAYNGGSVKAEKDVSKKPLFFDIALNYVQLDMNRVQQRPEARMEENEIAMKVPASRPVPVVRAKMEEIERASTPEPSDTSRGSGLGSLLGGWWGRK